MTVKDLLELLKDAEPDGLVMVRAHDFGTMFSLKEVWSEPHEDQRTTIWIDVEEY
jgi:hypothetical protein